MSRYSFILAIVLGFPVSGFAQFMDRGEFVEVSKGVKLCSSSALEARSEILDSAKRFWRVTSKPMANGAQTVSAFTLESTYDRESGEIKTQENPYVANYAMRFMRALEHNVSVWCAASQNRDVREISHVLSVSRLLRVPS